MEQLIKEIATLVQDYQNNSLSDARITKWIEQFDEPDRMFVLTELKYILERRYISKEKAKSFLKESLEFMQINLQYSTVVDFLNDCYFLDILENDKSQHQLILLLQNLIKQEYNFDFKNEYVKQKNIIYLDDILHTGNQVKQSLKKEIEKKDTIIQEDKNLILLYHFADQKQSNSVKFAKINCTHIVKEYIPRLKPFSSVAQNILDFQTKIEKEVEAYTTKMKYQTSKADFYEVANKNFAPFSSEENKKRFADIFLQKGIEIILNTKQENPKMRPLGFSLPSYKDFGFGSLCFTWLNVPNNTPRAFWGTGGGFYPLFPKK